MLRSQPAEAALRLNDALVRVVKCMEPLDLAIGETLIELSRGDRLLQLGYSRQVDYMRERLGQPPATVYFWTRLAGALKERPLLRRAVVAGLVTSRKAHVILPVARGDDELRWTAAATTATLKQLEAAVRAAGADPPEQFVGESLTYAVEGLKRAQFQSARQLDARARRLLLARERCDLADGRTARIVEPACAGCGGRETSCGPSRRPSRARRPSGRRPSANRSARARLSP